MNHNANTLLTNIRELTVELHNGELTDKDLKRLKLIIDVLYQIRADGVPDYPIVKYIEDKYDGIDLDVCVDYYKHE